MWGRRIASGCWSPICSSRVWREDAGPGSTSMPSTSQQPITWGRPRCSTSITRMGANTIGRFGPGAPAKPLSRGGAGGQLAFGGKEIVQPLLEVARGVAELTRRLVVARPEGDAVGGGDQLAQ